MFDYFFMIQIIMETGTIILLILILYLYHIFEIIFKVAPLQTKYYRHRGEYSGIPEVNPTIELSGGNSIL
jgi:hypothetical protein